MKDIAFLLLLVSGAFLLTLGVMWMWNCTEKSELQQLRKASEAQITTETGRKFRLLRHFDKPWELKIHFDDIDAAQFGKDFMKPPPFVQNGTLPSFPNISRESMLPSKGRLLETENVLDSPGVIGFDRQTETNHEYYAYQFILNNLKQYSSGLILYPFEFTFLKNQSDSTSGEEFPKGAAFTVHPEDLPSSSSSSYFKYLKTATNVSFGKAKALYDINIAVLKIQETFEDKLTDLTFESSSYCNILVSYLGKYSDCLNGTSYWEFKADRKNSGKTAFIYMDKDDIVTQNLLFTDDGSLRFQLLILPDYYLGADGLINTTLGEAGVQKIKAFTNAGGVIIATGKSGYLLEGFGMLPSGLYDPSVQLTSVTDSNSVKLTGCGSASGDFLKSTACLNLADSNGGIGSYLLSSFKMNKDIASDLTVLLNYTDSSSTLKKKSSDGIEQALTEVEAAYLPFMYYKDYGKGRIFVVNGNPLYKSGYNKVFYNLMFLAMAKNVMIDTYLGSKDNNPIPGGEVGVLLDFKLSFINLYDQPLNDVELHVWFPNHVSPTELPGSCVEDSSTLSVIDVSSLNASSHIKCSQVTVGAFEKFTKIIGLVILDSTVTKSRYDVLIASPVVRYTDTESSRTYTYDIGGVKTDAALAALLSAGMNPDPSAWYPQHGRGDYVDNMFGVENKEYTAGSEVDFVELIPLISPLVDMADQTDVARAIRFYPEYYTTRNYYFPWESVSGKNYDFLDYKWLNQKGVAMSADWDTPTKMGKVLRNSSFPDVSTSSKIDVRNSNWSTIIDNLNMVVKQIYYVDSDRFFEHATQRLLVFIDPTIENGSSTLYPNGIPDGIKNPNNPTTAKKELLWVRNDIYFYSSSELMKAPGLNYTHVISIDRYNNPSVSCIPTFGDSKGTVVVQGHFGSTYEDGLKENEYDNAMLKYCDRKKVLYSELEELTAKNATPIHYLVPVMDSAITRADHIMNFTVNADGTGQHVIYPELRFIYAHRCAITTAGGQGGKLVISLPSGVQFINQATTDPVEAHLITYSVDGIAFYKTVYDKTTNTLVSYYKLGGHASNVTRPATVDLALEELSTSSDVILTINSYEMKYDISASNSNYERYTLSSTFTVTASLDRYFSLPAVELHNKLIRSGDTRIMPYESISFYSRSGVYVQELERHRTVYGLTESHHVKDPGVQALNDGFSIITNLGIGWIPFSSYVTHGPGLLIPNGPSTSRIEWHDIWGRHWVGAVRSIFPDIPPIPAPVLTFTMTTTFEMTKAGTTERVLEWNSDEDIDIRVLIKVYNPYPKSFSITTCKDNEVPFFMEKECMFEKLRIFDIPDPIYDYQINSTVAPTDEYHINFGSRSVYGYCFDQIGTILKGGNVTAENLVRIRDAHLCADTLDADKLLECAEELADLPTVTARENGDTSTWWLYSPEIDIYYPKNYIKKDMWDLTHKFYEDNAMDKAFKYHLDDGLPGIDYGPGNNPARYKPHNIIAFPVFKGFGYDITYQKTNTLARFPGYAGWWSDQLQNKDHTLLAGQAENYDISVDKETLLPESAWINARDLINPITPNLALNRLKTIHCCLFNQHRVRLNVSQTRGAYLPNVVQNNVIPILSELTNNDVRYTNYDCNGVYQYSNQNISQYDSVVRTNTIRDHMMFAANLRAQAFETLNIILKMTPLSGVKYEGMTKVQDGGSFTYWNPPNGPNSYLVAGSPVSVVDAKRNDLTLACEVFPQTTTTLDISLYHLLTVKDPKEELRKWDLLTYTNNYGFGDSSTAVYVGGTQATLATLNPGDYTIIKVTFVNNAGFDWNLLAGAVEAELLTHAALGAGDLIANRKRAIQLPTKYNFMVLDIPDELKNYIEIAPSDHNLGLSPYYFDFLNINIMTISDGHSAEFYYRLNLSSNIPESLQGKVHEIGISINQSYFDKLPGYNDPTKEGFHDYSLKKIPSIKFGIPYQSGEYKGKVFYSSAYASNLKINATVPSYWNISEARLLTSAQITELRQASGDAENYRSLLATLWNSLPKEGVSVTTAAGSSSQVVSLQFPNSYPSFPKKNGVNPDITTFYVLMKAYTEQLENGYIQVISSPKIYYDDFTGKTKSNIINNPTTKYVTTKGAWLKASYVLKIVEKQENGTYTLAENQHQFGKQCYCKVYFTAKNNGDDYAYNANFTAWLGSGISVVEDQMREGLEYSVTEPGPDFSIKMNTKKNFGPGDSYTEIIVLYFSVDNARRLLSSGSRITFIKKIVAQIDLTANAGAVPMSQAINTPLTFDIAEDIYTARLALSAETDKNPIVVTLKGSVIPTETTSGYSLRFRFFINRTSINCEGSQCDSTFPLNSEIPLTDYTSTSTISVYPIPSSFTGVVNYLEANFIVRTYDEFNNEIASATQSWTYPSESNQKDSGSVLPLWAIILIPVAAITIIMVAAVLLYKRYHKVKVVPDQSSANMVVPYDQSQ